MKTAVWIIITALVLWVSSADVWLQDAMAVSIGSTTFGTTNTGTNSSTFTSIDGKPVNTNTDITQLNNQTDTSKLNKQGDSASTSLGLAAIAAGMAMVAAGMAMMSSPPTAAAGAALVAAGMMLIAAGMAALAAASNMRNNGNTADTYANKLGPTGVSGPTSTSVDGTELSPSDSVSNIKIDPALSRNGTKIDGVLGDFEQKTGLSRDDLINGLNDGKSPMEILAQSPKLGGASEGDLQRMMDKSIANNAPLTGQEVMDKLGLKPEDLNQGAYAAGGGDRKPSSAASAVPDFDSLFGKNNLAGAGGAGGPGALGANGSVSPEVQAALDRSGITSRSIFEMVHGQYKKKMPLMFGVKRQQFDSGIPTSKPLYDLKGTTALEF